jgi:hypothetical protein
MVDTIIIIIALKVDLTDDFSPGDFLEKNHAERI